MKKLTKAEHLLFSAVILLFCGSIFTSCTGSTDKTTTETNTVEVKKDTPLLPPVDSNQVEKARTEVIVGGKKPAGTPN